MTFTVLCIVKVSNRIPINIPVCASTALYWADAASIGPVLTACLQVCMMHTVFAHFTKRIHTIIKGLTSRAVCTKTTRQINITQLKFWNSCCHQQKVCLSNWSHYFKFYKQVFFRFYKYFKIWDKTAHPDRFDKRCLLIS